MCTAADQILVPMGQDPRMRKRLSVSDVAATLRRLYGLEVLDRDDSSVAWIAQAHGKRMLVELTAGTVHPALGIVYLLLLHTEKTVRSEKAFDILTSANVVESTALLPLHGLGSWCCSDSGKLTHTTFLPVGAALDVDPAIQIAAAAQFRAQWAIESGLSDL